MQKRENWVFGSECGKASSGHEERKQRLWMPRPLSLSLHVLDVIFPFQLGSWKLTD